MKPTRTLHSRRRERGTAIVFAMAVVVLLASLSLVFSHLDMDSVRRTRQSGEDTRLHYAAEAGLAEAQAILEKSGKAGLDAVTYPRALRGVDYWCVTTYGHLDGALGDDLIRIVCVTDDGGRRAAVEAIYRGVVSGNAKGARGSTLLRMDSNAVIDAWDSRLGTYASQAVNSQFGKTYALDTAPTGSNGCVDLDSNSVIFGDAEPGPGQSVSANCGARVTGSNSPAAAVTALDPVVVPTVASGAQIVLSGSATRTIAPGLQGFNWIDLGGSAVLTIQGPATVVMDSLRVDSNAKIKCDTSGGPVELYVRGACSFRSNSQTKTLDGKPTGLSIFCASATDTIQVSSNAVVVGSIHAPLANFSGSSNVHIYGAVTAKLLDLDSNARIHVDLALSTPTVGAPGPLSRLAFTPLSEKTAMGFARP